MAPTKEELLAFMQQAKDTYPHLSNEELRQLMLTHFADKTPVADQAELEDQAKMDERPSSSTDISQIAADSPSESSPAAAEAAWPVLNRRVIFATLLMALIFSSVMAGTYFYGLRSIPSKESVYASAEDLNNAVPYEIGDVSKFGKRFAANASHYDDKYRGKVLEMVGFVDGVERNADGYLAATILLADQKKRTVYRARFRFFPEQTEAIALTAGTAAVIKGGYSGYQDGVIQLFPAVVVYNSVLPDK